MRVWHPDSDRPHVGVVLPTREALTLGADVVVDVAVRAERLGYDSVWAGDSLLARPLLDPIAALAAVAAKTSVIRLGTGVLLAPLHQPVVMARALASVDQLSDGRLIVGVGRGLDLPETRREFAAAGVDFDGRTRRMMDTISLWRALWDPDGEAVDGIDMRPRPAQEGGPPIWLAGYGPLGFRRAGALADGWLPYPPSAELYRDGWAAVAEQAAADRRRVTPAVMLTVNVDDDAEAANTALDRYVETFYGYPRDVVGLLQALVAGPPDAIAAALHTYWDAGARVFVLRLGSLTAPEEQLERVAGAVLPLFAGRSMRVHQERAGA